MPVGAEDAEVSEHALLNFSHQSELSSPVVKRGERLVIQEYELCG